MMCKITFAFWLQFLCTHQPMRARGWVGSIKQTERQSDKQTKRSVYQNKIQENINVTPKFKLKRPYLVQNDGEMTLRNPVVPLPAWNELREHS